MLQMSSALGQPSQLLALLCQPAEVQGCVPLPPGLAVWGIDSGLRHCVGGSDYGAVRVGAFMGLRILSSKGLAPVSLIIGSVWSPLTALRCSLCVMKCMQKLHSAKQGVAGVYLWLHVLTS